MGFFCDHHANYKVYLSGDSGYGEHFKTIGEQFGPFDIAIVEAGQYNEDWALIHMMPEKSAQAAQDLQTSVLIPSHNSKFKLAKHAWYDPLDRVVEVSKDKSYQFITPMIGQVVTINDDKTEATPTL